MAGKTVEERLQTLEDIEEIRTLKALYCAACDDDHNPDRLGPLFAPDAVWEAAVTGRAEGREAIRRLLADVEPPAVRAKSCVLSVAFRNLYFPNLLASDRIDNRNVTGIGSNR